MTTQIAEDKLSFDKDALISISHKFYNDPLGIHAVGEKQHFLVHVVYKNWTERTTTFQLHNNEDVNIENFISKLMESPEVRKVSVGELLFTGRKSFGIDFDPDESLKMLESLQAVYPPNHDKS